MARAAENRMFYRVSTVVRAQTILERRASYIVIFRYAKVFSILLSDWLIFFAKKLFLFDHISAQLTSFCRKTEEV